MIQTLCYDIFHLQSAIDTDDYARTPGIDVTKQSVKGAGQFLFWDCAGQTEYALTHGMFLGVGQAIFIVTFDLQELAKGDKVG